MSLAILTPLQRRNLDNLLALREMCKTSQGEAAWTYAIEAEAIAFYAKLSDQDLLTISTELDLALFVPRHTIKHLTAILTQPPKLRGIYAAVSEPRIPRQESGDG
jgi:hypothetical protein